MCTVTYIPAGNGYFLTSSRDEQIMRLSACPPQFSHYNNAILLFPKDGDAGGSWIAINDKGHMAVLLNGGFLKHVPTPPYARSRGLVLLDIVSGTIPIDTFIQLDLNLIEPFTIILANAQKLYECRWTGIGKYYKELVYTQAHIWSSVTLYEKNIIRKREQWFKDWLVMHKYPNMQDILAFHQFAGEGDSHNAIRMNRFNQMLTVSITGVYMRDDAGTLSYNDLHQEKKVTVELPFHKELKSI